jgi:hypothetical protein
VVASRLDPYRPLGVDDTILTGAVVVGTNYGINH